MGRLGNLGKLTNRVTRVSGIREIIWVTRPSWVSGRCGQVVSVECALQVGKLDISDRAGKFLLVASVGEGQCIW